MLSDKINGVCSQNNLLRYTLHVISAILVCVSLLYIFIGVSEFINIVFGSSMTIDNYYFGSESMVGVGGLIYRTKYNYVFYNILSSLAGLLSLYFAISVLKDKKYHRIIPAAMLIIMQLLRILRIP